MITNLAYALLVIFIVAIAVLGNRLVQQTKLSRDRAAALREAKDHLTQATAKTQELESSLQQSNENLSKALSEVATLSQYRGIVDASAKAAEILANAESERTLAASEAMTALSHARQQAKTMKDDAQSALDCAATQATKIISDAHANAEQIAGEAYKAMNNAALYEKAARAMKNIVDGYGDAYLIPSISLLDDLAEEFGYTEAGEALKNARKVTRSMIRSDTAASCSYVEDNRRTTAIAFVTDAFNGKVDSILSRVRHDNAGTLSQEIRDAFTVVNLNGKAFRDAHITDQYLAARLDELRWAAVAQQLKLEEREEQRRVREQLREEEKARKEFERAIRDAAKEEDMLRKAMAKAQEQVAHANAEQRAAFEQKLAELTAKLLETEERNQRAISMAQQTRRGHVYIISNIGSFGDDVFKIGLTRRLEPLDRVRELGDSSVPFDFDVHAMILSDDAPTLETRLHRHFALAQVNKVNYRKEFFRATIADIRQEIEALGLECKWTMAAEARDYRETLAIERAIKDDPAAREAWLNRQLELDTSVVGLAEEEIE
ncbi:DUF4041 domain-containing protein [bacterium]|nr:DUF4041 domain-containing protein [bacterium]